jgi:hypothetical protein
MDNGGNRNKRTKTATSAAGCWRDNFNMTAYGKFKVHSATLANVHRGVLLQSQINPLIYGKVGAGIRSDILYAWRQLNFNKRITNEPRINNVK